MTDGSKSKCEEERLARLFRGFPLPRRERQMLEAVASGTAGKTSGSGGVTLTNLITRKWIHRAERIEDYGRTLYAILPEGQLALNIDDRAKLLSFKGARNKLSSDYVDLMTRWAEITSI